MDLMGRVRNILLKPGDEWRVIDGERPSVRELFIGYAMPLAAIGPIAGFIGLAFVGITVSPAGALYRTTVGAALAHAIVSYLLTLLGVFVVGHIINALAPKFGGTSDLIQAMKVAVYGGTAAWVAGIFALVPALSPLGLFGLYSIYLIYLGLPELMKCPQKRAMPYTVVVVLCAMLASILIGVLAAAFATGPAMHTPGP